MVRRLARRARPPPRQGLPLEKSSPGLLSTHAARRSRKKSPGLGSLAEIAHSWAEAQRPKSPGHYAGLELARQTHGLKPHQLSALHLVGIVETWRKTYSQGWTHQLRHALKRFLHFMETAGLRPYNPADLPKVRAPRPKQTIATADEITRLLSKAEPWLRLFVLLCAQLGLRFREAASLAPVNYDPRTAVLTFKKKGGDPHVLPATPAIAQLLAITPSTDNPHTPFIQLLRGSARLQLDRISEGAIRHAWTKLKRDAAVRADLTPHDLRRSFAVASYETLGDIVAVSKLLGHERLSTTARYLEHRDPGKLRAMIDRIPFPTEVKQ